MSLESKEPSMITLHNRLGDIRDRLAALSARLEDIHDQKPKSTEKDKATESSDISVVGLNNKAISIQWYLTECENALNKISG